MNTFLARVIIWCSPCVLFFWNNEILSLITLMVLMVMFIGKIVVEREKSRG